MAGIAAPTAHHVRLHKSIADDFHELKGDLGCDEEVESILTPSGEVPIKTDPIRFELQELRNENAKLKKDLDFSRHETQNLLKRNMAFEKMLLEAQRSAKFYSEIVDAYRVKHGPHKETNPFEAPKLYDW